jgi:hypothetical protein
MERAMTIAARAERVPRDTEEEVNRRIQAEIERSVRWHATRPERIARRLCELDAEWDIERAIEANASTLALAGIVLGARGSRSWLLLSALASAFLLQHALQGWCPPVPVLRRLGFRTAREIERERRALKALRGDFAQVDAGAEPGMRAESAIRAAQI